LAVARGKDTRREDIRSILVHREHILPREEADILDDKREDLVDILVGPVLPEMVVPAGNAQAASNRDYKRDKNAVRLQDARPMIPIHARDRLAQYGFHSAMKAVAG
jgi:hypothetical protein